MERIRIGLFIALVSTVNSDKAKVCICPDHVEGADGEYPIVMCGKELNFMNNNQNCVMEAKYRCISPGKETQVVEICKIGKVCGRDFGHCLSPEGCKLDKFFRMCYTVDGKNGPRSRCHKMYYELDDKGKLCCDKVHGKYKLPECHYY